MLNYNTMTYEEVQILSIKTNMKDFLKAPKLCSHAHFLLVFINSVLGDFLPSRTKFSFQILKGGVKFYAYKLTPCGSESENKHWKKI